MPYQSLGEICVGFVAVLMEAAASASAVVRSPFGCSRSYAFVSRAVPFPADGLEFVSFGNKLRISSHDCNSFSRSKQWSRRISSGSGRNPSIKASLSPESTGSASLIAPLRLESPIGQFLSQILVSHPHLVPAAAEQQLEQLQTDRDEEKKKEYLPATGTDLVLYRRIAKIKANERKKALEEILYALVVQKFMDANVSLVPTISPTPPDSSDRVDLGPSQEEKLEQLHSPEAYEMIQNHLALVLGKQLGESSSVAKISKLRVGQVYAASVMYGYFLKRVDQRFQLEKSMKILPGVSREEEIDIQQALIDNTRPSFWKSSFPTQSANPQASSGSGGMKSSLLRTYVMSFDVDTLQRYATIRSKEAITIIEKHAEALFGRPEVVLTPEGDVDSSKEGLIKISFSGLKGLVLEAVTFGSFLWDVESSVDSRYHFVMS